MHVICNFPGTFTSYKQNVCCPWGFSQQTWLRLAGMGFEHLTANFTHFPFSLYDFRWMWKTSVGCVGREQGFEAPRLDWIRCKRNKGCGCVGSWNNFKEIESCSKRWQVVIFLRSRGSTRYIFFEMRIVKRVYREGQQQPQVAPIGSSSNRRTILWNLDQQTGWWFSFIDSQMSKFSSIFFSNSPTIFFSISK